jgi:hypothetical protein
MERTRTTLLLLLVVGLTALTAMAAAAPEAAATSAQAPATAPGVPAVPALAAAGEPLCSSCLKCPCGCSPLAGAWVAGLFSESSSKSYSREETIIQTFKFAPVNDGCTKFVVNSQAATRLAKVGKFWPDACDQTEFVGIACKDEWKDIKLTAISYGVQRCIYTPVAGGLIAGASGEIPPSTTCPTTTDKVVFIAVMTAKIEISESCLECDSNGNYGADPKSSGTDGKYPTTDGTYTGECKEPKELQATIFVAYFDAAQDVDRDGFPDCPCDEAVLCVRFETCLKRVELMEPCDAETKSFVACLGACENVNTAATGRAFVKVDEAEQDVDVVVTVKDIKDVTKAALQINGADVLIVFPVPPDTKSRDGDCDGLLVCAEFTAKNFIGSLKGKKIADLLKAIEEGRVTVVVSTKRFPNGEICGTVEDP